jgi:hypothetical protein
MDWELLNCWSAKRLNDMKIAVLETLEALVSSNSIFLYSNLRFTVQTARLLRGLDTHVSLSWGQADDANYFSG